MEYLRNLKLGSPVFDVLLQDVSQHLACLGGILLEEVLLVAPQRLCPLAPGAKWSIVRDVAKQVEGIGFGLLRGFDEFFQRDAPLF